MNNLEQLEEKIKTFSDKVRKNVTIATPESLGVAELLHLSPDTKLGKMHPFIGMRQGDSEDRTVPRICVANSILGTIIGYSSTVYTFLHTEDYKDYKGGWTIYSMPFEYALKPNGYLVYDAAYSGEHWLITYNEETIYYKPRKVAKMFIASVTFYGRDGKYPSSENTFYLEVLNDQLKFNSKRDLTKGFYKVTGPTSAHVKNFNVDKDFEIVSVSKTEYEDAKLKTASLLSLPNATINKW